MRIVTKDIALVALFNTVSILLAPADLMPLWLSGMGMTASSLVVVLNVLHLADRPSENN